MQVAITGATGFLGRYIVRKMHAVGNSCRCWFRSESNCYEPETANSVLEWTPGELGNADACEDLLQGCDVVVHSGLHRSSESFQADEPDVADFVQRNVVGTIQLIKPLARPACRSSFIFPPVPSTTKFWTIGHSMKLIRCGQ